MAAPSTGAPTVAVEMPPLMKPDLPVSPEYSASWLSKAIFLWVNSLFKVGNSRPLKVDDLLRVADADDVANVSAIFESTLARKKEERAPKLVQSALVEQFKRPMLIAGIFKFANSTIQFAPPLLLSALLDTIADQSSAAPQKPVWLGYVLAVAIFVATTLRVVIENNYFHRVVRVGFQVRTALSAAVYRKSLRMSPTAKQDTPVGKIVNLMQLDAQRLEGLTSQLHVLWDSPYQILGYMVLLGVFLGWSALAGLASMLLLIPLQLFFMMRMGRRRAVIAKATDQRVKVTNEALQGVRTLKQYNWEDAYVAIIGKHRDAELAAIWRYNLIGAWNSTLMQCAPLLTGIASLLVYGATGGEFTAARIFAALSVLNQLRFPLMFLPSVAQQLADAKVSLGRLDKFMLQPEVEAFAKITDAASDGTHTSTDVPAKAPAATVVVVDAPTKPVVDAPESKQEDIPLVGVPEDLLKPRVAFDPQHAEAVGVAIVGGTFFHEEPIARVARVAAAIEEKALADAAAAKKKAKAGGKGATTTTPSAAAPTPNVTATATTPGASGRADNAELPPVLQHVDMVVPKGQLFAIIGSVGTGKSSLCAGILGELHRAAGNVIVNGRTAYVAQSAWVLNASVKKNITFAGEAVAARTAGSAALFDLASEDQTLVDEVRYNRVLDTCQLRHDITTLNAGDKTEIGERGINLSGGQKQRVSIARAAYADADVYIFDDPLSALDAEVGKSVFEQCIVGLLAGRTRILVTNQLQYLPQCDGVIVLGQDAGGSGYIKCQGRFEDLLARVPDFRTLLSAYGHSKQSAASEEDAAGSVHPTDEVKSLADTPTGSAVTSPTVAAPAVAPDGVAVATQAVAAGTKVVAPAAAAIAPGATDKTLMTLEEKSDGAVPMSSYARYFGAAGNFYLVVTIVLLAYLLGQVAQLVAQWWVTFWTSDNTYITHPSGFYMGIYVAMGVAAALFAFIRVITMSCMGIRASRVLHMSLVKTILHAPQSFFDTTPLGRILARFSKDFDSIDNTLMQTLGMLGMCIFFVGGSLAAIIFATPWFALVVIPTIVVYRYFMNYFRNVARETKRFDALTRSPIYAHFSETLNGLSTIRAYGLVKEFASQNATRLSTNVSAWYTLRACDRWLSIRLETLGNFIVLAAALLAVGTGSNRGVGNAAGLAGFSLSYASAITGLLNWLVRTFAEAEQTMNSVERVLFYNDNVTQEPYDPPTNGSVLPPHWPQQGSVVFKDYKMRYRETTPEVLHGLTLAVRGGEKIGIVGRTGAGKSSIMQALFRMTQDKCHTGHIYIDDVDIDTIGLNQLRSQLAIIPQDPVMFSGTIRSNLDPINLLGSLPDKGDALLVDALTRVGLKDVIFRLPGGLDAPVAEFGENLSAGQRQLLCLSRVLLRRTKIVLLDEASSSLDHESDMSIQRAIREAFPESTMLIIAHRLNTIIACDKVLVMDGGLVGEFAHPHELLSRPGSTFGALVDETGPESSAALRQAAAEAYHAKSGVSAFLSSTLPVDAGAADDANGAAAEGTTSGVGEEEPNSEAAADANIALRI